MAKTADKHAAYAIVAGAVGVIVSAAVFGLVESRDAHGSLHLFRGWALVFTLIVTSGVLIIGWIVLGLLTPVWDVPDLPKGESYFHRLRTLPERRESLRSHARRVEHGVVLQLPRILEWNRMVLELALVKQQVWTDYEHGLNLRGYHYERLLTGAAGPVQSFLSRCQDADHALGKITGLTARPGYGEDLSRLDEQRITDALHAVEAAIALADDAVRAVSEQ